MFRLSRKKRQSNEQRLAYLSGLRDAYNKIKYKNKSGETSSSYALEGSVNHDHYS